MRHAGMVHLLDPIAFGVLRSPTPLGLVALGVVRARARRRRRGRVKGILIGCCEWNA